MQDRYTINWHRLTEEQQETLYRWMKQAADECGYNTVDRKEFDPSHKESAFDGLYHILVDMKAVKVGDAVEYTSDSDEEAAEGAFMVEGTVLTLHPIDAALPDWHAAFTVDRPWIGFPDKRRYLDYREFARRIPSHTLIGEGIKALSLYASREDTSAELRELLQDICQHYGVATTPQPGTYPSTPEHRKSIALLHQYLTDPDAKIKPKAMDVGRQTMLTLYNGAPALFPMRLPAVEDAICDVSVLEILQKLQDRSITFQAMDIYAPRQARGAFAYTPETSLDHEALTAAWPYRHLGQGIKDLGKVKATCTLATLGHGPPTAVTDAIMGIINAAGERLLKHPYIKVVRNISLTIPPKSSAVEADIGHELT